MEICGSHTVAISRSGLRGLLPACIKLVSGPGCPVCVTSQSEIDAIVDFACSNNNVIIATFGDMLRVPGSSSSLEEARSLGADVRVVYSPLDALVFAREAPNKEVVFLSVGFETTAPLAAATVKIAKAEGLSNFTIFPMHKLTPPAMAALLDSTDCRIDGFLCPGHVTAIIGADAYGFIASDYKRPCVVAGFEPLDALFGIYMLVKQLAEGRVEIENEYDRVVTRSGNLKARAVMDEVFNPCDTVWRGLGVIAKSGLALRDNFKNYSAIERFGIDVAAYENTTEDKGCACAEVLTGIINPSECPLFASACTPESPAGPCMVSSEGACAAWFKYERKALPFSLPSHS
jgi:hydrogenase expression/formation protein HypD